MCFEGTSFGEDGKKRKRLDGDDSSSKEGTATNISFTRFLNREDVVGYEAKDVQPLSFWAGLKKLEVNSLDDIIIFVLILCDLFQDDAHFREQFVNILRASEFNSYFFEMPGVSSDKAFIDPFRFVLVRAPGLLGRQADQKSFEEHFVRYAELVYKQNPLSCLFTSLLHSGSSNVVSFKNLRGDATLVTPRPKNRGCSVQHFSHLADFVRHADMDQVSHFWQTVAREAMGNLKKRPAGSKLWMSTAGQGVSWLHFRLEDTPKYYSFAEYKNARGSSYY